MSGQGYLGGHTKIYLSEDGTIWPKGTHLDECGKEIKALTEPTRQNRWSDDGYVQIHSQGKDLFSGQTRKEQELRIIAEYANSYLNRRRPKVLEQIDPILVEHINNRGGVVGWLNSSATHLKRFWEIVNYKSGIMNTRPFPSSNGTIFVPNKKRKK